MQDNENIIVYDDYEISLYKYPRIDTPKGNTDIIIVIFLMHEDFLKKLSIAFSEALRFYNDCKEYYYIFKFNKDIKKYSAQEIMSLVKQVNSFLELNRDIKTQIAYLNRLNHIDKIFYFYIKNKDFYVNLFDSLEHAKKSYFERREYNYRINPPLDFYDKILPETYSAIELMELNAYAQYLIKNKIIQNLPIPKY
jgi:hypothetical protein